MLFKFLALAGFASLVAAQSDQSLIQALNSTSDLSNLTQILEGQTELAAALGGRTNITLLAPNNAAITAFLNASTANGTAPDAAQIQAILSYHVLNGTHQNFSSMAQFFPTALTSDQYTEVTGGQRVDVRNTTVLSGLKSSSNITGQSVNFTGGVIHIIDRILTIPESISATATAFNLTSFYGALNATDLLQTVNGIRDATVFVPNNAAFKSIGSALPNLTTEQITSILGYHIINGTVAYSSMLSNETVRSMEGTNLTITVHNSSSVFVNNARVIIPDVLVANGVVHVIDEILNPANTTAAAGSPAFSGASSATDDPYTTGQPTPTSSINTASIASSATGASSSSSGGAWSPKATGAVGAAALGGLALLLQL